MRGYALPPEADERRITAATDPDDAFDALYRGYAPALRAYCQARLGNPADAEDACHEAIIRAHAALPRFKSGRRLWPWLATIAGNVCRDMQRRQATVAAHTTRADVVVDDLDELAAARTRRAILADALNGMPERYRSHVRMCDLEGWSYQEMAALDGTTVASVRSTLHRARTVLRERVRDTADRRHQWPLPAFVPLAFTRLRARLARTRATAAPVAEPIGRLDALLGLVANPALAQGVFSVAALIGVGLGVAADHYVDDDARSVSIGIQNAASSSSEAVTSRGTSSGGDTPWSAAATSAPDEVVAPNAPIPGVATPNEPSATFSTPAPDVSASTPTAPSMPAFDAQAPSAPPPPVRMTSAPSVSTPIDGTSENYEIDAPSVTVDVPTAPQPTDPGDTKIELCSSAPSKDDGTVATLVCSGEPPPAPAPADISTEQPAPALPESELTLS